MTLQPDPPQPDHTVENVIDDANRIMDRWHLGDVRRPADAAVAVCAFSAMMESDKLVRKQDKRARKGKWKRRLLKAGKILGLGLAKQQLNKHRRG